MLTHLLIQNYALLHHQEIEFRDGFSVITGETGAGKSILLGALGLMLGNRADSRVLLEPSKKCLVEGTFAIQNYQLESFFKLHNLDYEPECILRREISIQGKSRAFINDTPVKLPVLKTLSSRLIDVHSQHENLNLGDGLFQLQVLDSYCGAQNLLANYQREFRFFTQKSEELHRLKEKENKENAERDYLVFMHNELLESNLQAGEQEKLEEDLKILAHSEEIKSGLFEIDQLLSHEDNGILNQLSSAENLLRKIAGFGESFREILERFESATIEITDLQQEINNLGHSIEYNPQHLESVKNRLNLLYSLQNKHRLNSVEELIGLQNSIGKKLIARDSLSEKIKELEVEIVGIKARVKAEAEKISKIRMAAFSKFNKEIIGRLRSLGMPDAMFSIERKPTKEPGLHGIDSIRFLFTANKGSSLEDVSRVASGGENSRLMLAVKSMISEKQVLPTIIFDEIDTGVSGAIAEKVGLIMKMLAKKMQVLAITHLPQIAGKADTHYEVIKKNNASVARTHIRMLRADERILEIARLLSGQEITESSLESAKHLLKN